MFKNWDVDRYIFMALSTKIAVVIIILLATITNFFPSVGHDYGYFIPRMIDTYLHYKVNGFSVQWYTPSFAGGLPAYPNPQHIQFSLPQILTLLTTPWIASLTSIAIFSLVGFFSTYYFLHRILQMHWRTSMLGALFYTGNGFYFQHMAVGHVGFQVFPLLSFVLILVFDHSLSKKKAILLLAFTGALLIYSAGFYPIEIFALSFAIILPLLYLIKPSLFRWRQMSVVLAGGLSVGMLLTVSKLSAILSHMRYFPREVTDHYSVGLGQSFLGLILQLLGVMNLLPAAWLAGFTARDISDFLRYVTGAYYGLWELDISISPVLVIIIFVGGIEYLFWRRKKARKSLSKKQRMAVGFLLLAIWINIEFIFAKGILFSFLTELPVLSSLHINVRYSSTFIFPLILVGSVIFNNWTKKWDEKKIVWISDFLSIVTIVFLLSYFFVADEQSRAFDASSQINLYHEIRQGETFPIMNIENASDADGLAAGVSGLKTIEGVFGYELEDFNHKLEAGEVKKMEDGYYNITNPASLVYPKENQLEIFERISIEDQGNFEAFINHYQPDWRMPIYQHVLDAVSLLTCIILLGIMGYSGIHKIWKYKSF